MNLPLFADVDIGILVATGNGGQVLYQRHETTPRAPGSCLKLLTTGTALLRFGSDHRLTTSMRADGEVAGGMLRGSLYLEGGGDPLLRKEDLRQAARSLAAYGLRRVQDDLVYDESRLEVLPPRYPPNARHLYAPISALTVNDNRIDLQLEAGPPLRLVPAPETAYARFEHDLRVSDSEAPGLPEMIYRQQPWGDLFRIRGTVTAWDQRFRYLRVGVSRPGLYAATLFREALVDNGIEVVGLMRQGTTPRNAHTLLEIESSTMGEIVEAVNRGSSNVGAELLNLALAERYASRPGTRRDGLELLRGVLRNDARIGGIPPVLEDAAGLAPGNAISPIQFVALLHFFRQQLGLAFVTSLAPLGHHPYARYPVPPPHLRVHVKTGTLPASGVNSAAGYVLRDGTGEEFLFAIFAQRRGDGLPAYSGTYTTPLLEAMLEALGADRP